MAKTFVTPMALNHTVPLLVRSGSSDVYKRSIGTAIGYGELTTRGRCPHALQRQRGPKQCIAQCNDDFIGQQQKVTPLRSSLAVHMVSATLNSLHNENIEMQRDLTQVLHYRNWQGGTTCGRPTQVSRSAPRAACWSWIFGTCNRRVC